MYDYMTYADVERLTGISKPTLRKWRERGRLPEPDYFAGLGRQSPAWKRQTIEAWWKERREQVHPD